MENIKNSFIPTTLSYVNHHSSMSFSILLSRWYFLKLLNPDISNSVYVSIGTQFLDELSKKVPLASKFEQPGLFNLIHPEIVYS